MFEDDALNVPGERKLCGDDQKSLPYFLLGDEIFPLKTWLIYAQMKRKKFIIIGIPEPAELSRMHLEF